MIHASNKTMHEGQVLKTISSFRMIQCMHARVAYLHCYRLQSVTVLLIDRAMERSNEGSIYFLHAFKGKFKR